jgi:hypothetical protein
VDNIGGAAFVCCSRIDGLIYARLLRSELAFALDRACAIGGGEDSVKFVKDSEVFCVLLTSQLLTDAFALFEIWTAIQHRVPLVPCVVLGAGYAFSEAAAAFADLEPTLETSGSAALLRSLLPRNVDIAAVGRTFEAQLASLIAITWSPVSRSENYMHAIVDDILQRMAKQKRANQTPDGKSARVLRWSNAGVTHAGRRTKGSTRHSASPPDSIAEARSRMYVSP